tara:strand:- start:4029 stop:5720 length:1692 start_codon:yes stop_codon:yes gene_type:complete
MNQAVGTTKGPGPSAADFTIITPDRTQALKVGEFVYYESLVEDVPRHIIGRISKRSPVRNFPDTFMSNPAVSPAEVASSIGFTEEEPLLYELLVSTLGYYQEGLGFINPRVAPGPGLPVFLADPGSLAGMLSTRTKHQIGSAHLGSLLTRPEEEVPIVVNVDDITSTHLAIIAGTGAGKSYLAAVIIEELLKPHNAAAVLVIDPHGEYGTLSEIPNNPQFHQEDNNISYRPTVKVVEANQLRIRRNELTEEDILHLLGDSLPVPQQVIIRAAIRELIRNRRNWTLSDLLHAIDAVDTSNRKMPNDDSDDNYASSKQALEMRISGNLGRNNVFHDYDHTSLNDLLSPGRCSVVELGGLGPRDQQTIVATLLRRAYRGRQATVRGEADGASEQYLPFPIFVLIEESHRFAPAGAEVISTNILKEILAEGRKFGVGVGLVSQRPGKLDQDVLSQCMTQCIMRIVNPLDQQSVAASIESVSRDLLDELPSLSKGQAVVTGAGVNTTILCRVRSRHTPHGGEGTSATTEWTRYFDPSRKTARDKQDVLFSGAARDNRPDLADELFGKS